MLSRLSKFSKLAKSNLRKTVITSTSQIQALKRKKSDFMK
jgi:hypothetical protein